MSNILLRPCCTIARNCVVVRAPDLFYHPPTIVVLSVPSVLFMLSSILMVTFFPLQSHEDPCFFFHDARMSYSTTPCNAVLLTKILPPPTPQEAMLPRAADVVRCCKSPFDVLRRFVTFSSLKSKSVSPSPPSRARGTSLNNWSRQC